MAVRGQGPRGLREGHETREAQAEAKWREVVIVHIAGCRVEVLSFVSSALGHSPQLPLGRSPFACLEQEEGVLRVVCAHNGGQASPGWGHRAVGRGL